MDNHREFTRITRHIDVDLQFKALGLTVAGSTRDLSLNGMFVEAGHLSPLIAGGSAVEVVLHVDGRGGVLSASGRGTVVRRLPQGLAIHIDELIEVESYDILKNLILYHAADPAKADREFESHLGLRAVRPPPQA